jgi:hypothetical protein
MFLHNLQDILTEIANTMGLQKKRRKNNISGE